ncbi:hypothetical protein PAHAL_5G247800 [Panicum hallii]|uniref:ENT domain-containing protein n=1 Tax=Panicum hallii TaxID=206008 RepID=A0A2S3HU63_9POAL|nr:uncharacterized protein LOC112894692 [Panicum hallii]PAN29751.1 hypothetical protein PAHAL_5G247800 [Panicum hallii]
MRIRKGSQVEVWTQEAGSPVGAWRVGEVMWGNGHSYTLRWHDGGEVSGRISRKSVRPRPPPAPVSRDLDAGNMVEVFDDDDCLWKCAEVRGPAVGGDRRFDVKIVGAAKVLTVPPQRLRIRQVLRDDDVWVALHKDNQIAVPSTMPFHANGGSVGVGTGRGKGCYKPMLPGSTPLLQKRSFGLLGSKTVANGKRFEGTTKRLCAKEEPRYEAEVIVPNVCLNKQVDMCSQDCDVVSAGSNSDDDHLQQQQENEVDVAESDSESNSSSDDSSSSSDSRTRSMEAGEDCKAARASGPCNDQKAGQLQPSEKEHCDSVAESREIIKRESETLNDQKATVQEHIHRLELEAYSTLMKAFHACGNALSWEKVELLSDLRTHLHITNDDHLQVLNVILNRKGRFAGSQF